MEKNSLALGTFDGLHIGHLAVLSNIMGELLSPVAITFKAPPKMIMSGEKELLMAPGEKKKRLRAMGIKPIELDFNSVKDLPAEEFLNNILKEYNPGIISCGFNFRFGKKAAGDVKLIERFCSENNITFLPLEPVNYMDESVSSTRIRRALKMGDMRSVKAMLSRCFSFEGEIVHGDERGRTIGFPTVNQFYPKELVTPRFGVYLSVTVIDKVPYKSITNIGIRPTFKTDEVMAETHILDFEGDAYGKTIRVILTDFIRDEVKFNSLEELKAALERDKEKTGLLKVTDFAFDILY